MFSLFSSKSKQKKSAATTKIGPNGSFTALLPFFLFVAVFVGSGFYFTVMESEQPFGQISAAVAILPAIVFSIFLSRKSTRDSIQDFMDGSGHLNIITMVFIYMLAGAFSEVAKEIGAVQSTVNFGLQFISGFMLLPGIFIISALISVAMGTSMGTIAAMAPIAFSIADATDLSFPLTAGALMGGAMFGDNLSLISDTTIASVQTQMCNMRQKFKLNAIIAVPAMIITIILFARLGTAGLIEDVDDYQMIKVMPYALVLTLALMGMNVMVVLTLGIFVSGCIGLAMTDEFTLIIFSQKIFDGFSSMTEIILLSLMVGGLSELVKSQGGLKYLIRRIAKLSKAFSNKEKSRKVGEYSMSLLVSFVNLCTANNTVAILISGEAAHEIAQKNGISSNRSASLIDIFSCVVQGLIPYAPQVLLISSIVGMSPLTVIANNYYCMILGLVTAIVIFTGFPKKLSQ